jgi:hypothetical protein
MLYASVSSVQRDDRVFWRFLVVSKFLSVSSIVFLGTLAIALSGCSESVLLAPPTQTNPTRVDAVIEVTGEDPDNPHIVNFGEVNAGDSRDQLVTIRNIGTDTLQVQDLVLSNFASFEIVDRDSVSPLLTPEQATTLTLRYSPVQDEHIEATLTVASNDRETPEINVRLLAEGLAPTIRVEPQTWDFGNMELGCVSVIEKVVSNVGRAPLLLNNIWFEDLAGNGEMTLIHNIPPGVVLAPNDALTVEIHYVPIDVEPDNGVIHFESNDPSQPDKTARQFGIAHLGESNVDEFAQEGNNSSDILWVVDNSCSMSGEQTSLAVNFSSFIQIVDALDMDYHIGVVTTDVGDNGALQGSTPIVTPSTPDPAGTFATNVDLGIGGSGSERGFQSAYLCYNGGACLSGFDRGDDSGLRIIFVSDEQEQSTALGTVADYVAYFYTLRGNPDKMILSDITGGLSGCSGSGGGAGSGSDYVAATVTTGGVSASICDSNWVATLSALAWLSQSYADTFELSQTPVEDTIEVRLNGVNIYVGWTFNSALNAIIFDLSHIPEAGDGIEIEYTVLGDCGD